ncbi:hypothetical protein EON83_18045 [bacterium]|nr:MAG: hypothetical protein EON83_18045 [bacterium]
MEFEILKFPQFEDLLRRVAAAFEVELLLPSAWKDEERIGFYAEKGELLFELEVTCNGDWHRLSIGQRVYEDSEYLGSSNLYFVVPFLDPNEKKQWEFFSYLAYDHLIARAFYRLGFEDEIIFSTLPELSTHEKLELRLSMPREFWPQKWLEGEVTVTTR